ncbi:hypothetical protein EVAR_3599_1 [Eumeta japonica]|uniref:Uncharacterized protein n=1 Tax=Eumeta variegata TaxID=151549 RepID=A0A4C1SYK0_EUMVA|nr:hypothetical protein EVAR_3599_1 [Eumeta japonica]
MQRTKLCRSELPANDALHRFNAPRPFLLIPGVPILCYCDAFLTNFTAAEFRALYCTLKNICRCHRICETAVVNGPPTHIGSTRRTVYGPSSSFLNGKNAGRSAASDKHPAEEHVYCPLCVEVGTCM